MRLHRSGGHVLETPRSACMDWDTVLGGGHHLVLAHQLKRWRAGTWVDLPWGAIVCALSDPPASVEVCGRDLLKHPPKEPPMPHAHGFQIRPLQRVPCALS